MGKNRYMDAVTQGVYILGVKDAAKVNFMTAAWITQVSASPNKVLVAVGQTHFTAEMIRNAGKFTVNVLGEGQEELAKKCGRSSGRNTDKSIGVDYELTDGVPVVKDTAATLYCTLDKEITDGDHVLFISTVKEGKKYDKQPLIDDEAEYFG